MKRNPIVAGLLSFFIPGLGQIYAGKNNKGAFIIVGAIIVANLNIIILPLISVANPLIKYETINLNEIWTYLIPRIVHDISSLWSVAFWIWAIVDAVIITMNKDRTKK